MRLITFEKWHISLNIGKDWWDCRQFGIGWWKGSSSWFYCGGSRYDGLHWFGFRIGPFYYTRVS